jgi:DNA-directed RNA polymerase subunit RPC12/RpoP
VIDRSGRIQCKHCKEFPVWTGRECNLCGTKRTVKPRRTAKKARFEALLAELIGTEKGPQHAGV